MLYFRGRISLIKSLGKIEGAASKSYLVHTHHLFDEFAQRDLISLNAELNSLARNGDFQATWALFCRIHSSSPRLDAYTFTPVLKACSALSAPQRGTQVHCLMMKMGTDLGTVTKTALIDMYSKYGLLNDSVKAFEEVEFPDVVCWNSLLSSFLRHGLADQALAAFGSMRRVGIEVSEFTLCSLIKACASIKAFQQGKQVHALVVVAGRDLVVLSTALIDFYSNCGLIDEAVKVFSSLGCRNDDVICNSLISGCIQNKKYKEAFSVMSMTRPNAVGLTSALAACSENWDLYLGMQIHGIATRYGFASETQFCNKLVDMYAKCGKISNAKAVFDRISLKNVVSFTSMIDAFGRNGQGHEALKLFNTMGQEVSMVSPNSVALLAVLSACGHSGLVAEGLELFNQVKEKHGLEPGVEHYSCFIDVLGRAGKINEAWELYDDMVENGTRPTAAVWAALLNACSVNADVSRGEFAAMKLLELEPNNPGNFVMLSNFYASVGKWESVDNLRNHMRNNRLTKTAGSSWVRMGN